MILGRGVVGISDSGVVFVERPISVGKAKKAALKAVGRFVDVVVVGRIYAVFADNPVFPMRCSPNYGVGQYETCRHCVTAGDICRVRGEAAMSDGSVARVVTVFRFNVCESWVCWVFARFLNKYGWIRDSCIEEWDNVTLDRGNEGERPDMLLFAGSEDGRLGLFVRGIKRFGGGLPPTPFRVRVQSVDYWSGDKPQVVNWETTVNGSGLFLVWFGNYVLPFMAYYSYPAGVQVKPGFSGSNAFIV